MKILHIAYSLEESSAATRLAMTQENRHEIFFLLGRLSKSEYVKKRQVNPFISVFLGITLHIFEKLLLKFLQISKDEIFSFGLVSKFQNLLLKKIIKAKEIDVIHLHWGGYSFCPLNTVSNLFVPIVITAHDYHLFTGGCHLPMGCKQFEKQCQNCPLTNYKIARWVINKIRIKASIALKKIRPIVTTPSQYTNNKISHTYPFLKTTVVGNTVGNLYLKPIVNNIAAKNMYLINKPNSSYVPTIITVGTNKSTRQNKGQDILNYVLMNLHKAGIKFNYISVGSYEKYIFDGKRVHFDKVSQRELKNLYLASDLCLVTSRYETFSQVALESILCGTPVVAFDNSGPNDIIVQGETGFLVPAFDENKFYQTTKKNLNFKRTNIELIISSVQKTASKYSTQSISHAFDEVYDKAIKDFIHNDYAYR